MRLKAILYLLGALSIFLSLSMLIPLLVSLSYGEGDTLAFLLSAGITFAIGLPFFLLFHVSEIEINHKEGFAIVAFGWVLIGLFGALPYLFSGALGSWIDAYFESVSGFTTTGATVFPSLKGLPHGVLLWRSLTHWLGGMGIILFSMAILPILGVGGMQLYRVEAPSVASSDRLAPRIVATARLLWLVYLIITGALVFFLLIAGMPLFDAVIHAFGTVATGGFSNMELSIESYNSPLIESIILVFMLLSATNFALHFNLLHRGISTYKNNTEFRFYIAIIFISVVLVTWNLRANYYPTFVEAFRYASFNTVSISTTTGFSSTDFARWPYFSQYILVFLMIIGGSVGSTAGAIKTLRITILLKAGYRELRRLIHPHAVVPLKLNSRVVPSEAVMGVMGFTFLYLLIFVLSSLAMTFMGMDIISAISSVASTLGGVGPGLGKLGPLSNYGSILPLGKGVLIMNMLLGRLEIYTILVLFLPEFWRR
ncbi:MAG: TrkH family potassium uptake protein [Thermodesulfobacteriota bacterium]